MRGGRGGGEGRGRAGGSGGGGSRSGNSREMRPEDGGALKACRYELNGRRERGELGIAQHHYITGFSEFKDVKNSITK